MAHDCVDWTATPPARKTPLLVLSRGDDHVYTVVPDDLQTLEQVARKEFGLGDDLDVHFLSRCASLCHGQPARITEHAWEHLSPYIGCATVVVSGPRSPVRQPHQEQSAASETIRTHEERNATGKRKAHPDDEEEQENGHALDGRPAATAGGAVQQAHDVATDHGSDHGHVGPSAPEDNDPPSEEEESTFQPQRLRSRRRIAPEDDEEIETSDREHNVLARSPSKPEIREKQSDHYLAELESQPGETLHRSDSPIKQERSESGSGTQSSHAEPQYGTQPQTLVKSGENYKVMIRITHRPSQQESKFTAKGTTKVAKVLSGACRSFGLDASQASLYLIVSATDEDGEIENLFPCDKSDTIIKAGAERDTESRFLLKTAGEA